MIKDLGLERSRSVSSCDLRGSDTGGNAEGEAPPWLLL
jgi:hypothetical protein